MPHDEWAIPQTLALVSPSSCADGVVALVAIDIVEPAAALQAIIAVAASQDVESGAQVHGDMPPDMNSVCHPTIVEALPGTPDCGSESRPRAAEDIPRRELRRCPPRP